MDKQEILQHIAKVQGIHMAKGIEKEMVVVLWVIAEKLDDIESATLGNRPTR